MGLQLQTMRKDTIPGIQAIDLAREKRADELDLIQFFGTVWRGKWLILLCIVIAVLAAGYYAFGIAVPRYTSNTVVALESRDSQVIDFEGVVSGLSADKATVNTEVEVLRARILFGKLAEQLSLQADPEFNPYLRPAVPWSPGAILRRLGLVSPPPPPNQKTVRDAVIDELLMFIKISNVRDSYVFHIRVTTEDPEKSALIADTLANLYINDQVVTKFQATEKATEWLTDRVTELKAELQVAETAVKEYNTTTSLIGPEALAALNRQLKDLRSRLETDRRTQADLDDRLARIEAGRATGDIEAIIIAAEDPALTAVAGRIGAGDETARPVFDNRLSVLVERFVSERTRLVPQIAGLAASVDEQKIRVEAQSADLVKLQQLEREAAASGLIYEYFLGRLKETSVQQGIQQADSRVLSNAVVATTSSWPNKRMMLAASALVGAIVGVLLVLFRELRQSGFRSAEDLEAATGVTVIGQIPRAPNAKRKKVLDYIATKPTSALVEAVRNLRTSILLSNVDKPPQVIMMTSSVPGEGKTTQTLALAHNLAGLGRRVLVIEGDIRRRTFGEYFDLEGRKGLLSAVAGDAEVEDIVWRSEQLSVDILIGEKGAVNAADFFSSAKFSKFIDGLRQTYDVILIDTPAVLVVPDARVIAQLSDAVIYVVHWDKTSRTLVEQGLHAFNTVNVPVTGLVLSQVDPKGMKRYGEAYAAYGSKYYGN